MILYSCSKSSLEIERQILHLLSNSGAHRQLETAKQEKNPNENIYEIIISVEEL